MKSPKGGKFAYIDSTQSTPTSVPCLLTSQCMPQKGLVDPHATALGARGDFDSDLGRFQYTKGADLGATSGNPLAETLLQIYSGEAGVGYVLWNDQPLSKSPKTKVPELHAHAKGAPMSLAPLG